LLTPVKDDLLDAVAVSRIVNSPNNDVPEAWHELADPNVMPKLGSATVWGSEVSPGLKEHIQSKRPAIYIGS